MQDENLSFIFKALVEAGLWMVWAGGGGGSFCLSESLKGINSGHVGPIFRIQIWVKIAFIQPRVVIKFYQN